MLVAKASEKDVSGVREFLRAIGAWHESGEGHDALGRIMVRLWPACDLGWERVLIGYELLAENCCDPSKTHLALRPDGVEWAKAELESERKVEADLAGKMEAGPCPPSS